MIFSKPPNLPFRPFLKKMFNWKRNLQAKYFISKWASLPSNTHPNLLLQFGLERSPFISVWSLKRTLLFNVASLQAYTASGGSQGEVAGLFCNCSAQKTQLLPGLGLFAASLWGICMICVTSDSPQDFSTMDYLWQCFPEISFIAKRPKVMSFLC